MKPQVHIGSDTSRPYSPQKGRLLRELLFYLTNGCLPIYFEVMTKTDGRFSTKIRRSIRELFFSEPKKGKLINDLLEKHYGKK